MSILIFIFVISLLIVVHELGHFIAARAVGVKVEKFSIGFGPALFKIMLKGTEFSISLIPIGGYVKMAGDEIGQPLTGNPQEFLSRKAGDKTKIVCAGAAFNYLLGFLLFWGIFIVGSPVLSSKIGGLVEDFPAETSGLLQEGDTIVSVNGNETRYWNQIRERIQEGQTGESLKIEIRRDGEIRNVEISPVRKEIEDVFGKTHSLALIGIEPSEETRTIRYNPFEAFWNAGKKLLSLTGMMYKGLWGMITGKFSLKQASGPIGIFIITGNAAKMGGIYLMHIIALISVNLAVINLLPVPVLDGGHLIFFLLESIFKKADLRKLQAASLKIGWALLILLMLVITFNDLTRIGVWGKIAELWMRIRG